MARRAIRFLGLLLAATLLAAVPRAADAAPDAPLDLRYAMYWGGLHVADMRLVYDNGPAAYRSELSARTVGVAEWLAAYRGEARIEGLRNGTDSLQPEKYTWRQESKQASHTADVTFDPETGDAREAESTKRGRSQRIEVPETMWSDVIDPLTAFLELREALAEVDVAERPRLTVNVFDGRRRYDIHAEVLGRSKARVGGRDVPALEVELTVDPIAGFNEGDREPWRVHALLSDDDALVPIELRTLDETITGVVRLSDGYTARSS